jgi:hypothetical protein
LLLTVSAVWILVAAVCGVVVGKAVRSVEVRERPAPVVPQTRSSPSPAEEGAVGERIPVSAG